jgi:hypothetical protein
LWNIIPVYHHWKQDELYRILQATQKHCDLQNLQTKHIIQNNQTK